MSRLVAKVLLSVDKAADKRTEDISTFLEAVESKNPQISPASPSDFEKLPRTFQKGQRYGIAVLLCCAVSGASWKDESKMKRIVLDFLPLLESEKTDKLALSVVDTVMRVLVEESNNYIDLVKSISSILKKWDTHNALLQWSAVNSMICASEQCATKSMLSLVEFLLEKEKEDGWTCSDQKLSELACKLVDQHLALVGGPTIRGSYLLLENNKCSWEMLHLVLQRCANLGHLFSDGLDNVLLFACVLCELYSRSDRKKFKKIATSIFRLVFSAINKDQVLTTLDAIGDGIVENPSLQNELQSTHPLLRAFALLYAPQIAAETMSTIMVEWMTRFFTVLPILWDTISEYQSYKSMLSEVSRGIIQSQISQTSFGSASLQTWKQISTICHAHLFHPHPLVANFAVDLWCIMIKCSGDSAYSKIPSEVETLVNNLFSRYYFANTTNKNHTVPSILSPQTYAHSPSDTTSLTTIQHLLTLDPIHSRLKSILFRVASSLPQKYIDQLGDKFISYNVMKLLNFENVELFDRDCLLLDTLPLKYLKELAHYNKVLGLLVARLTKLQGGAVRAECTPSLLLTYRAILSVATNKLHLLKSQELSELVRAISTAINSFKNATLIDDSDWDLLAIQLDILGTVRASVSVMWKSQASNLVGKLGQFTPVAKIAFIQYLAKNALYDLAAGDPQVSQFSNTLVQAFEALLIDPDWLVASEAIVAYFSLSKKLPLQLQLLENIEVLTNFNFSEDLPHFALSQVALQLLLKAGKAGEHQNVLDTLSVFKQSMFALAEQLRTNGQAELLRELSLTNVRLAQLESQLCSEESGAM